MHANVRKRKVMVENSTSYMSNQHRIDNTVMTGILGHKSNSSFQDHYMIQRFSDDTPHSYY